MPGTPQYSLFERPEDPGSAAIPDELPSASASATASAPDPASAGPSFGASAEDAVSVTEVNRAVRQRLEGEFGSLWVKGEISNWRAHTNGHRYFTLRDDSAQLKCVMWRSDAEKLPAEPEEGMEVCARGQLTVYEARGSYQLVVRTMQAEGEGLWRLAFEKLRRRLQQEGLLDDARKTPLPRVPLKVGVVTSRAGAAVRDVVSVIQRRAPWTRILISDCRVQGPGSAAEIVLALDRLVREGSSDVIILTRGGGSIEDLWAFNEEIVARAIAECPVPTISAVGHEIDVTIADLVADCRAPTPSVAGEMVVEDSVVIKSGLQALAEGLVSGLRRRTDAGGERLRQAAMAAVLYVRARVEKLTSQLALAGGRLEALSPLAILSRGYAVPLSTEGRVLRSSTDFEPGVRFRLRIADGEADCVSEGSRMESLTTPAVPATDHDEEDGE
ncbi:MAG: exodeoxyribonuclease VII large subunit [Gemmatimonadota bacterium]